MTGLLPQELKNKSPGFYTITADGASITCHVCGFASREPDHVEQRFCPRCVVFHEDRILMLRLAEGYERALEAPQTSFARV
jgi:hypothetical protein